MAIEDGNMNRNWTIAIIVVGMLLSGAANSVLSKYQDRQCVENCDDPDNMVYFEQPVIQTFQMFIGESGCWIIIFWGYLVSKRFIRKRWWENADNNIPPQDSDSNSEVIVDDDDDDDDNVDNRIVSDEEDQDEEEDKVPLVGYKTYFLVIPTVCDILGTTMMNAGLLYTTVSTYQMSRGNLVLFVAIFSTVFLGKRIYLYQWFGVALVVVGVFLVGLTSISRHDEAAPSETFTEKHSILEQALGVLLIAGAQIFTAFQYIVEEWILDSFTVETLHVVGYEGAFGMLVTGIFMILCFFFVNTSANTGYKGYFDISNGIYQVFHFTPIWVSSITIMISIGLFNFFGVSVTRVISSATRSQVDICRTVLIWMTSLALGWENFHLLQLIGFALIVYGTLQFNGLLSKPTTAPPLVPEEQVLAPDEPPAQQHVSESHHAHLRSHEH